MGFEGVGVGASCATGTATAMVRRVERAVKRVAKRILPMYFLRACILYGCKRNRGGNVVERYWWTNHAVDGLVGYRYYSKGLTWLEMCSRIQKSVG